MKDLKVLAGILMVGVLFGFAACKTETDSTVAVEKIEITSTVKEVTEGEKITLEAKVSPENATNKTVTWSSSDATVATVDKNGVVTGVKAGKATITAKAGEKSTTVEITMAAKSSESGSQAGGDTGKTEGGSQTGGDTGKTEGGSQTSGDTGKTEGSGTGTEEGGKTSGSTEGGNTSGSSEGGSTSDKTETVAVTGVEIISTVKEVTEGEKITLTATVSPENATNKTVTWTSSDTTVATVDEKGVVTGVKAGKTTITAKAGEQSATVDITVNAAKVSVTKVTLTVSSTSVNVGNKITLTPTVEPENATDKTVTYTFVSGADFASIEGNELKGKSAGSVKIKAIADGVSSEEVMVDVIPVGFVKVAGATVTGAEYTNNYPGVFPADRTVELSDFYMGKYEVTQAEYKEVMQKQKVTVDGTEYTLVAEPSYCTANSEDYKLDITSLNEKQENRPVESVTWYDAVYYCNVRSEKEGLEKVYDITITEVDSDNNHITDATVTFDLTKNGYRLPTEAEWEYAARGGDQNAADWNYTFSGADTASGTAYNSNSNSGMDTVGWYAYNNKTGKTTTEKQTEMEDEDELVVLDSRGCGTHEVGKKAANRLGIYDMSGNVQEWCYDWYSKTVDSRIPATGPTSSTSVDGEDGDFRVFCGGSWLDDANQCTVSYRKDYSFPAELRSYLGFRVVRSATQSAK